MDFGIAKVGESGKEHQADAYGCGDGDPAYMSPEQCCGASWLIANQMSIRWVCCCLNYSRGMPFRAGVPPGGPAYVTQPAPALAECVSGLARRSPSWSRRCRSRLGPARGSGGGEQRPSHALATAARSSCSCRRSSSPLPPAGHPGESTLRTGLGHVTQLKREAGDPVAVRLAAADHLGLCGNFNPISPSGSLSISQQSPVLYAGCTCPHYHSISVAATLNAPIPAAAPSQPKLDIKSTGLAKHIDTPVPDISIKAPPRPPPSLPGGPSAQTRDGHPPRAQSIALAPAGRRRRGCCSPRLTG